MKKKVRVTLNGKTTEGEVEVRNTLHFEVQRRTRSNVFRDKTKYNRKLKHKNKEY